MDTLQDEKDPLVYQSLPYEVAHAIVRTLCLHTGIYLKTRAEHASLKASDPKESKAKTRKAREAVQKLTDCYRYCVMNRRTGFVATSDWLQKHMILSEDGKPQLKKPNSKCKPWILTLKIVLSGLQVDLELKTGEGKEFRSIKCFDIGEGKNKRHLPSITVGYQHLFEEIDEEEDRFLGSPPGAMLPWGRCHVRHS